MLMESRPRSGFHHKAFFRFGAGCGVLWRSRLAPLDLITLGISLI